MCLSVDLLVSLYLFFPFLCLFLSLSLCLSVSPRPCLSLTLSLSLCLFVSVFVCVSLSRTLPLNLSAKSLLIAFGLVLHFLYLVFRRIVPESVYYCALPPPPFFFSLPISPSLCLFSLYLSRPELDYVPSSFSIYIYIYIYHKNYIMLN